jgi:hypothetical protein
MATAEDFTVRRLVSGGFFALGFLMVLSPAA